MIAGEVGPIEGSRMICRLRYDVHDDDEDAYTPFIAIDSESDDLVVGNRDLWDKAEFEDRDRRYKAYDEALRPGIAEDCRALLAVVVRKLHECPACGFTGSDRPPYDVAGAPSYETCACCAFQIGLTDVFEYDSAEWRRRWIQDAMPFRRPPAPPGWDPVRQMRAARLT